MADGRVSSSRGAARGRGKWCSQEVEAPITATLQPQESDSDQLSDHHPRKISKRKRHSGTDLIASPPPLQSQDEVEIDSTPDTAAAPVPLCKAVLDPGTIFAASPRPSLQPLQHHSTRDSVAAPVPSPPADPLPSTSGNTPTICPRPYQTVTASQYFNLLFPADRDDGDSGSDSDIDIGVFAWPDDSNDGSSSSSDEEDPLHTAKDGNLFEGKYDDEGQAPLHGPSGSSFAPSEGLDFVPHLHKFQSDRSGITKDWPCNDEARESDFFCAFLDDEVLSFIAEKTNKFYCWVSQNTDFISPKSRMMQWVDTTPRELMVFFALMMVMPLCKMPILHHYWRDDIMNTPFRKYMTWDRFIVLLSFLFFTDIENYSPNDHIWQVREIFPMFPARFKKYFSPSQKMIISNLTPSYKGRLVFKHYFPSKRYLTGTKLFLLCDCESGTVFDMMLYTGTDADIPKVSKKDPFGMSGAIIKKMMAPYLGKGHILYTGNLYISPALYQFLHDNSTGLHGTGETNRGRIISKLCGQKTCSDSLTSDDTDQENNEEAQQNRCRKKNFRTKKAFMKSDEMTDYSKNIRLMVKSDCQISSLDCLRKSTMWYCKFFFHMMDITMVNAYNFWTIKHELSPNKRPKLRKFIYNVGFQLLQDCSRHTTKTKDPCQSPQPDRIVEGFVHYLIHTDMVKGKRRRLECYVCKHTTRRPRKRTRVKMKCYGCNTALCIGDCFSDYHTYNDL